MKFLCDNDDHKVGRHCVPNLRFGGVLAVAQVLLDAQVLFDLFEKQFVLLAVCVQGHEQQWWQHKDVGQINARLGSYQVRVGYASQVFWVLLRGVQPVVQDRMIENHSFGLIHPLRVSPPGIHVAFDSGDEECSCLMHFIQVPEAAITAVHCKEHHSLDGQDVLHTDCAHLPVDEVDNVGIVLCRYNNQIELVSIGSKRRFDGARRLVPTQLRKRQHVKLFCADHAVNVGVATAMIHDSLELRLGYELHELRNQPLASLLISTPNLIR